MVFINILNIKTQGQKIKEIRKRYRIRQEYVSGNLVTRNLISMIENDKVKISKNTAEIVTENINKYFKENQIEEKLDLSYILKTPKEQLNDEIIYILGRIDESPNLIEEDLSDIILEFEYYFKRYELFVEGYQFFKELGIRAEKIESIEKARNLYINAFNYYYGDFTEESILYIIKKIGDLSIILEKYDDTLKYNKYVFFTPSPKNITIYKQIEKNDIKARGLIKKKKEKII